MASSATMTAKPFLGSRIATSAPRQALKAAVPRSRQAVVTRAGYLGSPTNLIFIASTAAFLTAGRFGLAPTAKKHTKAGVKLYDEDSEGLTTGDPAGYTATDVLVGGSQGHVIAVGLVLGLRAIGWLA